MLLVVLFARALSAITYVIPDDRFEIERSSAIIAGRVLRSHVEGAPESVLETVTEVAVEEAIKGDPGFLVRIHVPVLPGAPSFTDGERVLLFLYQRADGSFVVNDLHLGAFHFVNGVFVRDASEVVGWDPDGRVHEERPRSAQRFLDYVRGVARGEAVSDAYFVSPEASAANAIVPNAAFTATSYTLQYSGGVGSRWNVFPGAVNWNQGNSETGALGSGTPQINNAFSAWNAGGAHYVLASATANTKGFLDAADGVNNFVFEKDLTSAGIQPFSCTSGGALGMGGMRKAGFGAGAHVFHGETFATTLEADVSMNQGIANCTTSQLAPSQFASVITHEIGHTLGFRHSDQNRLLTAACSTDPTLDCSSQALMNHILVSGLNGQLQAWDKTALAAVYGSSPVTCPPVIPGTPSAGAVTGGFQLSISVTGGSSFAYKWFEGPVSGSGTQIGTGNPLVVNPAQSSSYWSRITNQCGNAADSAVVRVNVCVPPRMIEQPKDQQAAAGTTVQLIVRVSDPNAAITWFQGASGNTATAIGSGPAVTSPVLTQTTQFWARATSACGSVDSDAATITVKSARRRSTRH